ncbi:DUF5009 domain-containing protein [Maribellus sp. YY47]|uniref:DUF5009 domain-containing protein n=1 Tax=Maribellus sp. YY47 TaxID=2929486 RepID=UPI002001938B|nr:DUF5009 domain-containing protein [Maribellus sp. YY47]MCK3685617.1 DUF5009 domain-containing protein [Maribellus sp. YY47]
MKRAVSLDVLRGLSIFGMILSGTIPFGSTLPAWMYHAQCPPPTHAFNPGIPGISWVDLVLPVFIFCMGAAIPLALRKKLERGQTIPALTKQIAARFATLVLFAIYIAHIMPHTIGKGFWNVNLFGTTVAGYDLQLFTFLGFLLMFPMFATIRDSKKKIIIRTIGWGGAVILLLALRFIYGQEISLYRSNIIILLLANVYLWGALGWLITRKSMTAKLALFMFWAAIQLLSKYTGFGNTSDVLTHVSWLFKLRMTFYLILLIPSTIVGEWIAERLNASESFTQQVGATQWKHGLFILAFLVPVWLTISLFSRWMIAAYTITPILLGLMYWIASNHIPKYKKEIALSAYLILMGLILEPVEGGIRKDYVTASYLLITGGIATCLLLFLEYLISYFEQSKFVKIFEGAGSNPLMAYVMSTWFAFPLLNISFLIGIYNFFNTEGYPWIGVLRATCLVISIMMLVNWIVKKKIVWRV